MVVQPLASYNVSSDRGFLCSYDADKVGLTGGLGEAQGLALQLPQVLPTGRVRSFLENNLPDPDAQLDLGSLSEAELRMAMVHYSFMVQAYVWGEPRAPASLPACLARPMVALADSLGQQPLLPYSGYVLDNWAKVDPEGPIELDNLYMIQGFLGGQDEAWFVLIHVAIEATAGQALASIPEALEALENGDHPLLVQKLEEMASAWVQINGIFDRMPERCDPYIYFERVRPFIHGWKDNPALPGGVLYEGVERFAGEPQAFRGQTGSQSSIVPVMDAFLGVGHAADPLRSYLDELHIYRPPGHRRFIEDVREASRLRQYVEEQGEPSLVIGYNSLVQAVADFRSRHLEYAASYINMQNKKAAGNDVDVGTGGTPFMRYLKKHRDETRSRLLELPA